MWLVNTGWTAGRTAWASACDRAHARNGERRPKGELDESPTEPDPIFGLPMPVACPAVPDEVLNLRNTWADQDAYDRKAREVAALFVKNFEQFVAIQDAFDMKKIVAAGPKV